MCELQQGATLVFSEDGAFEVISIPRFGAPIPVIDDADLDDTGFRVKCPGSLADPQVMSGIVCRSIGTADRPTRGLNQTCTITHGDVPGNATPESFAGSGFVVDFREPEFTSDTEGRKTIEIDWQYDGVTGPARTKAVAS
jgi:hypothetical protein